MRSPTEWANDPRLDGPRRWLSRYHPFITTVLAVVLIAVFLPGRSTETTTEGVSGEIAGGASDFGTETATTNETGATTSAGRSSDAPQVRADTNVLTFEEARKQVRMKRKMAQARKR